jgi:hypothetical protein
VYDPLILKVLSARRSDWDLLAAYAPWKLRQCAAWTGDTAYTLAARINDAARKGLHRMRARANRR